MSDEFHVEQSAEPTPSFQLGDRVSFEWSGSDEYGMFDRKGTGTVLVSMAPGHVLVAIDPQAREEQRKFVIWCAETWLTKLGA